MLVDRFDNPLTSDISEMVNVIATKARVTQDTDTIGNALQGRLVPPSKDNLDWSLENFDPAKIVNKPADQIIKVLSDSSPELSRALHEMYQQVVTDYEFTYADADEGALTTEAKRIIDNVLEKMETELNSPLTTKLEQFTASGYLKGAFYSEAVFNDMFEFVDLPVIDPYRAFFIDQEDPVRGQYQQLAHRNPNGSGYIAIESPFVQYTALNAIDGSAYGRSFVGSAIYPMVFLLSFMKAARRVVMTQAWPHGHFTISRKELIEAKVAPKAADAIMRQLEKELKTQYETAEDGSAFITGSEVGFEIVGHAGRNNGLNIIEMMINLLTRWIILALKQYGINFSVSSDNALSTDSDQQLLSEFKFINSFQSRLEKHVGLHFNQILRQYGNPMKAVFKLDRDSAKIQRIIAESTEIEFKALAIADNQGWLTKEEARLVMINPEGLRQLSDLVKAEMPPELIRQNLERANVLESEPADDIPADAADAA